jgi:hypothetical protein
MSKLPKVESMTGIAKRIPLKPIGNNAQTRRSFKSNASHSSDLSDESSVYFSSGISSCSQRSQRSSIFD